LNDTGVDSAANVDRKKRVLYKLYKQNMKGNDLTTTDMVDTNEC